MGHLSTLSGTHALQAMPPFLYAGPGRLPNGATLMEEAPLRRLRPVGVEDLEMAATLCLATLLDARLWARPGGHRASFCSCGGSPRRAGLWAPHVPSQQGTIAVLTERLIRGNVHRSGAQASQRQTRPERVRSGWPEVGPENLHF